MGLTKNAWADGIALYRKAFEEDNLEIVLPRKIIFRMGGDKLIIPKTVSHPGQPFSIITKGRK
jgi:hypothetical protein